jgi:hypothetical protein
MEKEFAVFRSFADAERADRAYYRSLTPSERVDILLELISRWQDDETAKGFERIYRVAQLHED